MSEMARSTQYDWQVTKKEIRERGKYLLETGIWSDCRFIVGTDPNQQILEGHKLFLAMASPVFEAMFFGGMAEKDPIAILDVQPDAFKALLEYIYTDKINLTSFDQACELCYGAKKYMLPHLVEECTKYLWSDLTPKNACRAYEFAKLFEEPILMEKCLDIICQQTQEVLSESSFEDVELSTLLTVFDQESLNVDSEMELFEAVSKYANRQCQNSDAKVPRLDIANPAADTTARYPTIRDALKKIRFLTLSPQQFAEGPASSNLLTQSEKFALLMNISSSCTDVTMPEGFTVNKTARKKKTTHSSSNDSGPYNPFLVGNNDNEAPKRLYCVRELLRQTEYMNTSVLDCAITFSCDKNICVYGIQIPAQILIDDDDRNNTYTELLYAHLLDGDGSRLTYTHFTSRVAFMSLIDISFNRPVYIQKNKVYKVGVVLNKMGCYPVGSYPGRTICNGVGFYFGPTQCSDSLREGLIRTIIFSIPNQSVANCSLGSSSGMQGKFNI